MSETAKEAEPKLVQTKGVSLLITTHKNVVSFFKFWVFFLTFDLIFGGHGQRVWRRRVPVFGQVYALCGGGRGEKEGERRREKKKWTICCFRCAANPLIEPLMLFKLATGAKLLMKF